MRDFKNLIIGDVLAIVICYAASRLLIPDMGMKGVTLSWGIALVVQTVYYVGACLLTLRSHGQEEGV